MPSTQRKPAIKHLTFSPVPSSVLIPTPTPALIAPSNNHFFQKFIRAFLKKAKILVPLFIEAKVNISRLFKLWNLDLYYCHLHIKCYYFYYQCVDYFKFVRLLSYKYIFFIIGFFKYNILNQWQ